MPTKKTSDNQTSLPIQHRHESYARDQTAALKTGRDIIPTWGELPLKGRDSQPARSHRSLARAPGVCVCVCVCVYYRLRCLSRWDCAEPVVNRKLFLPLSRANSNPRNWLCPEPLEVRDNHLRSSGANSARRIKGGSREKRGRGITALFFPTFTSEHCRRRRTFAAFDAAPFLRLSAPFLHIRI